MNSICMWENKDNTICEEKSTKYILEIETAFCDKHYKIIKKELKKNPIKSKN